MSGQGAPEARPLARVLEMNTRLLRTCLDGVSEQDARARPGGANSMAFIVMHVADARYYLAGLLGPGMDNPLAPYTDVQSLDEAGELPGLGELLAAWDAASDEVLRRVRGLSPESAAAASPVEFPIGDATLLGAVAFLVQHESYHLGQLGLLRRQLGYPGMRWRD